MNIDIRHMKRHKCRSVVLRRLLKFVASTDAAFKAQPEEPTGLARRGLAATCVRIGVVMGLMEVVARLASLILQLGGQRRVVRLLFSAEFNGLVDSIEQMLLLQCALHRTYCGTTLTPDRMFDLFERGLVYPPLDVCAAARAVYDAIRASDACEPAGSSLNFLLISVRDRMTHGFVRKFFWVDTRDMLADGLTKGGKDCK